MPWQRTFQLIVASVAAYGLGLYTYRFAGGGWDWTNVVGLLGCVAVFLVNLLLLIRYFWKPAD